MQHFRTDFNVASGAPHYNGFLTITYFHTISPPITLFANLILFQEANFGSEDYQISNKYHFHVEIGNEDTAPPYPFKVMKYKYFIIQMHSAYSNSVQLLHFILREELSKNILKMARNQLTRAMFANKTKNRPEQFSLRKKCSFPKNILRRAVRNLRF